ncbi:MAG: DUF1573 domain-containing protein [Candidatus Aminicenantes bacterium]|nr:DUF1573 domain-containing protein [Candidatus Aminicenantes bacterium]
MKKILIAIFIIVPVSFSLFSKAAIQFKATSVNFGQVEEGDYANVKFEFENTGDSLLILKRVLSSCGCTTVGVKKKEFKPGEKGVIPVKFDPKGYYGHITKVVTVHTNDPDNPTIRLMLSGNIILKNYSEPVFEPDTIDFGEVKAGKKYKGKIKIKNIGTIDLEIEEVFHVPELIPEFSEISIKPKTEAELLIEFKPMRSGKFFKFVRIRTNSYKKRMQMIKITAQVK